MKILHYKTVKSHHDFTSRADLMAPATLLERLELGKIVDRMMPAPGSNRGYRHSIVFETFLLMFHEGAQYLEDMRHLRKERGLVGLMGFRSLPCAATLGNWLRRVGRHAVTGCPAGSQPPSPGGGPAGPGSRDPRHGRLGGACE